ncbi:chemotaxis protein CheW [Plasticicumulans acidivorans]|uniref:Twitching motility protein PilI n=1 Tax=Plasticicumulans acidivorans TaxID=886464 RepID=A0A317MVF4_9GAMM|nr:chemotaxis protein CheW [Plasticicumulans acidivorans]PWV62325.1 twitching motility protein PilI [Plasticicumulans acidivorans]
MSAAVHPFDQLLDLAQRGAREFGRAHATQEHSGAAAALALRVGSRRLLFRLAEAGEIVPTPALTKVPGVQPWLLGIASLRGRIVSVVDLNVFFGGRRSVSSPRSRVIVVGSGETRYGLLVDEVIGMRPTPAGGRLESLPESGEGIESYLRGAFAIDGAAWLEFDVGRLLADPRFMSAAL